MTFDTNVVVNNGKSVQTNKVLAPTTSGGSTYGAGTSGQVLTSNGTGTYWSRPVVILTYGVSTYADFENAFNAGAAIFCRATTDTTDQTLTDYCRYANLSYVNFNPSLLFVEFMYYRSTNPANNAYGDEIFIYKLTGEGVWSTTKRTGGVRMVVLSYGSSTWNDFINAYSNNAIVYCRASNKSDPSSGNQTRMAFMAYVNDAGSPTEVEFQYYRSVSSHSSTAMGDEIYIYKLNNTGTWSVTTRNASVKEIAVSGDGLSASWSNDKVTLTTSEATTSVGGLMSAADKTKLNGIATGATANVGTITGITMNGASKGTSGVVDLGTVITSHQDISGKVSGPSSAASGNIAIYDGATGKVIKDSGYTIAKSVPSDAKFSDTTYTFDGTYNASTNKAATVSTVTNAINALDGGTIGTPGTGKTITALSQTNGNVSATFGDISITKSQVSDFPTSMTPASHTHGNIQNGGALQTTDVAIANGDKLVVTDSSDSNKVARTSLAFDGSTATKCLTQKGTFESFTNNAGTITGITMNGASKGTSGVVDLGTVITAHQTIPTGSTSAAGIVQLTDSTSSTSTTTAATPNSVKSAYTLASGKANPSNALSLTLAAGSWTSATPPTQTLTATGVTSSNNIIVGLASTATSTQYDEAAAAKILCTAQGTNSITLTCYGTEPIENIPISVLIVG